MSLNNTVILLTDKGMGKGQAELQITLLSKYLHLLLLAGSLPAAICMYTEGVKLVLEGSPALTHLQELEKRGVRLIVCSTCLNYFGLEGKIKAGIAGSMADILEAQTRAEKVITL